MDLIFEIHEILDLDFMVSLLGWGLEARTAKGAEQDAQTARLAAEIKIQVASLCDVEAAG
jgi:hypothetical protein